MRPTTRLIVSPRPARDLPHVEPLDLSTTYRTPDPAQAAASIDALAEGRAEAPNPIYARLSNPNVRDLEERMTSLEEGGDSVAFATGMASITALLLSARRRGSHVVAVPPLYGGTHHLLETGLLGTSVTWAAPGEVSAAIREDTSLVLVETPANPTLSLTDIQALVEEAGPVPVAVDSTFAPPVLQQPLRHGATFSIHSATKFIGGHGDALGGVITTTDDDAAAELRQIRIATGAILHPLAAHLLVRGLRTLGVRMAAAQANATELAARLARDPHVLQVSHPGQDARERRIVEQQMKGPGAVLGVRLEGGPKRADAFIRHLTLMVPAVSLGCVDSLVQRPAALTHRIVGSEGRDVAGIPEDLIRISVGLEDVEDLWEDISQALAASFQQGGEAFGPGGPGGEPWTGPDTVPGGQESVGSPDAWRASEVVSHS